MLAPFSSSKGFHFFAQQLAGISAAVLCASLFSSCKKNPAPPPQPARPVVVAPVVEKEVPIYLEEIGNCVAYENVQIQAQANGQIIKQHFQDGAYVKKGDLLFSIDARPYQAELTQAVGNLAQVQAQLNLDTLNLARTVKLRNESVAAQQDLDTAQANVSADKAKVETAQGSLAQAQVNLGYCTIISPIDGRAGLRMVDVGNIVNGSSGGGNSILLTVQKFDPIYTDFTVAENDLPLVRSFLRNGKIKVLTYTPNDPNKPIVGKLYFIDNEVQTSTGTVKVRGISDNPNYKLWPGQFVNVKFVLDTVPNAKLVPSQALQISQKGPFVFVVKKDSTVEMRPVKVGQRQGESVVIEEGVKKGEMVVITGQLALAPGSKVIVKQAPPEAVTNPSPSPSVNQ